MKTHRCTEPGCDHTENGSPPVCTMPGCPGKSLARKQSTSETTREEAPMQDGCDLPDECPSCGQPWTIEDIHVARGGGLPGVSTGPPFVLHRSRRYLCNARLSHGWDQVGDATIISVTAHCPTTGRAVAETARKLMGADL